MMEVRLYAFEEFPVEPMHLEPLLLFKDNEHLVSWCLFAGEADD